MLTAAITPPFQLSEELRCKEQAVHSAPAHEEPTADLKQKLTDTEMTLAEKEKELCEKARKVKQASV